MRVAEFFLLSFLVAAGAAAQQQSGLPGLKQTGVMQPSGKPGELRVLDWAGLRSAVTYTFDDALASQLSNYPRLHATGVRMTFFLTTNHSLSPDWAQVFQDGNEAGNHTAHHCRADGTSCGWGSYAGSLEAEYDQCNEFLKKNLAVSEVLTTASPYGDTGYDETAKTRFVLNRGVWGGFIAPNDHTDPYNLLAHGIVAGEKAAAMNAQIDGAHSQGSWVILLYHSLGGDGGYAPVDVEDVLASIRHAQSLGDVWIDSMVNVGTYWLGQKAVTDAMVKRQGEETVLIWTLPEHFPPNRWVRVTVSGGVLRQNGKVLPWNSAGYYEVALDPGRLTISAK